MTGAAALFDDVPESGQSLITPQVLDAVRQVESGGGKYLRSPKGAEGSYGLMPVAAGGIDPYSEDQGRKRAEEILKRGVAKFGDLDTALMAYHAGEHGVEQHLAGQPQKVSGVGPLTKAYPGKVRAILDALNPIGTAEAAEPPAPASLFDDVPDASTLFADVPEASSLFSDVPDSGQKPGAWSAFGTGIGAGVSQLGEQASTLKGLATGTAADAPPAPQEPDELAKRYADVPFLEKVTDPTWLSYFVGSTIPGSAPFMAGAAAGAGVGSFAGPLGTLIGGMIGGGTAAGMQSLADAYNEARQSGRDHDGSVDYAMKQAALSAGINAATIPAGLWGLAKGPIAYALRQVAVQPVMGGAGQMAENVYARESGVAPERSAMEGVPEAMLGEALFETPAQAVAMRHLAGKGEAKGDGGVKPPADIDAGGPPPPAEPPVPVGDRVVLRMEDSTPDEQGRAQKTISNEDVTIQGYDPASGLYTLTRDSDGAHLGEVSLDDFQRMYQPNLKPHEPAFNDEPAILRRGEPLTETTSDIYDKAVEAATERGMAEEPFSRPQKPFAGEDAPGLTEADRLREDAALREAEKAGRVYPEATQKTKAPELPGLPPEDIQTGTPPYRLDEEALTAEKPRVTETVTPERASLETEASRYAPEGTDLRGMTDDEIREALPVWKEADTGEPAETMFSRPYEKAPDSLMGFRKEGINKGFDETNYKFVQPVRMTWDDGTTDVDAIKGLNKAHALERARRNWPAAQKIEPISAEQEKAEAKYQRQEERVEPGEKPRGREDGGRETPLSRDLKGVDYDHPAEAQATKERIQRGAKAALEKIIGKGVESHVFDELIGKWDGRWHDVNGAMEPIERVIAASLQTPDMRTTLQHEGFHWLEEADVVPHADQKILNDQAKKWMKGDYAHVLEKYPDVSGKRLLGEVKAHAFGDWRNGKLNVSGPIRRIFQRIADFLHELRGALGLQGARSWRDVFSDIEKGKFKDRAGQFHQVEAKPNGTFELKDPRTGDAIGWYNSRAKAVDAAIAREKEHAAANAMNEAHEQHFERLADEYAKGKTAPQIINSANRMALFERTKGPNETLINLSKLGARLTFPRSAAKRSRAIARVYSKLEAQTAAVQTLYRDNFSMMRPWGDLKSVESRSKVMKAGAIARMQSRNIIPTGQKLIIRNGDTAIRNDKGEVWIKPNEVVKLSQAETEAYFAVKATMAKIYRADTNAKLAAMDFTGDVDALRAAVKSPEGKARWNEANPGQDQFLTFMDDRVHGERAGYVPFARYGDVQIGVKANAADKDSLGGHTPILESVLVDTDTLKQRVFGNRRERKAILGSDSDKATAIEKQFGPEARAKWEEMKREYEDTGRGKVLDPRFVTAKADEDLPHSFIQRMITLMSGRDEAKKAELFRGYREAAQEEFGAARKKHADNVAGFSTDWDRVMADYVSHTARSIPMIEHGRSIDHAMDLMRGKALDGKGKPIREFMGTPSEQEFMQKAIDYTNSPSNDYANIRKLGFTWYLWGNMSSAVVNLSQTPLVTIPYLAKWGGSARALMETTRLTAQLMRPDAMMFGKRVWSIDGGKIVLNIDNIRGLSEGEKAFLRTLERDGTLQAQITGDMTGTAVTKSEAVRPFARTINKIYEAGASLFGAAEVVNRAVAGLAAYRMAQQPGAMAKFKKIYGHDQLLAENIKGRDLTPEDVARWSIKESQFDAARHNTPEVMRGVGAPLLQFKRFTANYLSLLSRQAKYEGASGKAASAAMLFGLLVASGLRGIPFADDADNFANWAVKTVTGIDPMFDTQIKEWAQKGVEGMTGSEDWGRIGAHILMHGASGPTTGMELGQRFGQGQLVPQDPVAVLGPAASAFAGLADGVAHLKNGQLYQGLSKFVPKAIGNPIEALGYKKEGIATKAGNEVMSENELTTGDQIKKGLGFQPAKVADRQENAFELTRINTAARQAGAGAGRYLGRMIARAEKAKERGDMAAAEEAMQKFQDRITQYEKDISDPNRPGYLMYKINRQTIKSEVGNALDWSRRFAKGPKMARPEILRRLNLMGESVGTRTNDGGGEEE